MKILMVCLGNICRSPLADGLLRKKVKENNLNVFIDSAGTSGLHAGSPPDSRMCKTAKKFNTSIDELRSRKFLLEDLDKFDWIYVMDKENLSDVLKLARNENDRNKVQLILNTIDANKNQEVPDPYYGGDEGFLEVYRLLDNATDSIVHKIKNNLI